MYQNISERFLQSKTFLILAFALIAVLVGGIQWINASYVTSYRVKVDEGWRVIPDAPDRSTVAPCD